MLQATMRLLEALANVFINTFGITQPTDATRRRASWIIFALLLAMGALVVLIGMAFHRVLHA